MVPVQYITSLKEMGQKQMREKNSKAPRLLKQTFSHTFFFLKPLKVKSVVYTDSESPFHLSVPAIPLLPLFDGQPDVLGISYIYGTPT